MGFGLGHIFVSFCICLRAARGTRDTARKEPSEVNANCRHCAAHDSFSPLFWMVHLLFLWTCSLQTNGYFGRRRRHDRTLISAIKTNEAGPAFKAIKETLLHTETSPKPAPEVRKFGANECAEKHKINFCWAPALGICLGHLPWAPLVDHGRTQMKNCAPNASFIPEES